jgi:hypothetical protein
MPARWNTTIARSSHPARPPRRARLGFKESVIRFSGESQQAQIRDQGPIFRNHRTMRKGFCGVLSCILKIRLTE